MTQIYEPLLDPGIHECALEDVEETCVTDFGTGTPGNPTVRQQIMGRFEDFIDQLQTFNTTFEVWIDGSFVTDKPKPNDVDVVIFGDLNSLSKSEVQRFHNLMSDAKYRYMADAYFSASGDKKTRSYWRGWFAFNREEEPKGIFSIDVN